MLYKKNRNTAHNQSEYGPVEAETNLFAVLIC